MALVNGREVFCEMDSDNGEVCGSSAVVGKHHSVTNGDKWLCKWCDNRRTLKLQVPDLIVPETLVPRKNYEKIWHQPRFNAFDKRYNTVPSAW